MPLPRVYRTCQDQQGNIVPNVLGSVFNQGTGTLAPLWNDDAGTVPLSNPMTSDATYGSFKFYIAPGHYDLTFTKPGYTFEPIYDFQVTQDVLTLGTMAVQNANAVAITGGTATLATLGVTGVTTTAGRVDNTAGGFLAYDAAPGGAIAYRTTMTAGTGRLAFSAEGNALSAFSGALCLLGAGNGVRWANVGTVQSDGFSNAIALGWDGTLKCRIDASQVGTITVTPPSDARLKVDVQEDVPGLAAVEQLRAISFAYDQALRPVGFPRGRHYGLVAQEAQPHVPLVVTADDSPEQWLAIDYQALVPVLIQAVQELAAQVRALAARSTPPGA